MDERTTNQIVELLARARRESYEIVADSAVLIQGQNPKFVHIQALAQESKNEYTNFLNSFPSRYREIEETTLKTVQAVARTVVRATQVANRAGNDSLNTTLPKTSRAPAAKTEHNIYDDSQNGLLLKQLNEAYSGGMDPEEKDFLVHVKRYHRRKFNDDN